MGLKRGLKRFQSVIHLPTSLPFSPISIFSLHFLSSLLKFHSLSYPNLHPVPILLIPFPRLLTRSQAPHMNKSKSKRVRSLRKRREDPGWTEKHKNPVTRSGLSKQLFFHSALIFQSIHTAFTARTVDRRGSLRSS